MFKTIKTADDLANEAQAQQDAQAVSDAKAYLASTDFYFVLDKYNQLSDERKLELEGLREQARVTIRELENKL
jgi:hypothetical protein